MLAANKDVVEVLLEHGANIHATSNVSKQFSTITALLLYLELVIKDGNQVYTT